MAGQVRHGGGTPCRTAQAITAAARSAPAPAPIAPARASDGRADGTTRSTSRRARRASSTSACPSSRCTTRRAAADTQSDVLGAVLEAGCAGAGHRSSGCCSCHSRSYAATSVSRSRARRLSSVRGRRFSIISRTCSSCSATSKSCWSQAWWSAIRTLSDSRRVYLPIGSGLRRSWSRHSPLHAALSRAQRPCPFRAAARVASPRSSSPAVEQLAPAFILRVAGVLDFQPPGA